MLQQHRCFPIGRFNPLCSFPIAVVLDIPFLNQCYSIVIVIGIHCVLLHSFMKQFARSKRYFLLIFWEIFVVILSQFALTIRHRNRNVAACSVTKLSIKFVWWLQPHCVHCLNSRYSSETITPRENDTNNFHYSNIIMVLMVSQIIGLSIVYSGAERMKHQNCASLAFVDGIHRRPVNSPHKEPVTPKIFPIDDIICSHRNPRHVIRTSVYIHKPYRIFIFKKSHTKLIPPTPYIMQANIATG